jgi:uncharacterized protein (DUF1697 family)
MSRHAAFLRGMNVGGHRLTNAELGEHFTALGFAEVATFRASGNVIFEAGDESTKSLRARIETGLLDALGYAVPTFLRSGSELRAIASREPFPASALASSNGKPQVALLARAPASAARSSVLALAGEQDRLELGPRELYWLPSGGILDSALDIKAIEKLLGPMTMRTIGTIQLIASKHFGL